MFEGANERSATRRAFHHQFIKRVRLLGRGYKCQRPVTPLNRHPERPVVGTAGEIDTDPLG